MNPLQLQGNKEINEPPAVQGNKETNEPPAVQGANISIDKEI